jgi:glycosyltransferase involved in cell wall biosynthesis
MNIVHITEAFGGGIITYLRYVLPAQVRRGHQVHLLCTLRHAVDRPHLKQLENSGVTVIEVDMNCFPSPGRLVRALRKLRDYVAEAHADVVHTHCFRGGLLGRLACRHIPNVAVTHTPHCFPFLRVGSLPARVFSKYAERWLTRWTDHLIVVSESEHRVAVEHRIMPKDKVTVVPNAIDIPPKASESSRAQLADELGLILDRPVVGTVSRLVKYKRVVDLVHAARILRDREVEAWFVVVGDGPQRDHLVRLTHRLGIADAFRWPGYRLEPAPMWSLFGLFVAPAMAEGMPYTLLEAMAGGVPIVASNVPGHVDLIEDGQTGLLYPCGDIVRLAEAIRGAIQNSEPRKRLVDQARLSLNRFSDVERQVGGLMAAYGRIAKMVSAR